MYLRIKDGREISILHATEQDWEGAMALAWRTFSRFEAPIYSQDGVESFIDFISGQDLKRVFLLGRYRMFLAKDGEDIVGMISVRESNHISLLFVDGDLHGQGIGRALIDCTKDYLWDKKTLPLENEEEKISDLMFEKEKDHFVTVNAAPIAVGFYHKLGFHDLGPQENADGIDYIPMCIKETLD